MTKQLRRLFAGVLALVAFTACDDGTDPVATATVEVLAYVDVDESNDFNATDDPIEGATVTLTMVGASEGGIEATTGSDGVALFNAVEVGSYTASIELPASLTGVTLASATAPSVVVNEDQNAEASFRYTYNPGQITGHAFIGTGDYADGAIVVPGLTVTVSQDGSEVGTAETGPAGAYTVAGLLPGDYDVEIEVPAYLNAASATEAVTLAADEDLTVDFGLEARATHTIAEARDAAEGDTVAVIGVAITGNAGDQAALSGSSFYMQDADGISIYLAGVEATVELGDEVLVYGERGAYQNEVQLSTLAALVLGEGTLPTPEEVTVADINDGLYQGQLAVVRSLYVDEVEMEDGDPTGNVLVSDLVTDENLVIYVDADAGIDIPAMFTAGETYDITGVVARFGDLLELKPRMPADIEAVTVTDFTIADARVADGETVTVTGVVSTGNADPGSLSGSSLYMQDATAGIPVFLGDLATAPGDIVIGDLVEVTGLVGSYQDHPQITADAITVLETVPAPTPAAVTPDEVLAGEHQAELGQLVQVVVDSIDGSTVYVGEEGSTTSIAVYVGNTDGLSGTDFIEGEAYDITGIVTTYWGPSYQVLPRMPEDIVGNTSSADATVLTVAEARNAAIDDYVEVTGVVTVDSSAFGGTNYIQADGAGISIYWAGNQIAGEQVTVVGSIAEYRGNLQIAVENDSIVVLDTVAVPDPVVITGTQLNAGEEPGELVTLESFTVTNVEVLDYDNHIVTGDAGDGQTVNIYVDSRNGMASGDWTVGTDYSVTGIVAYRDDGWYLWPRQPADVTAN